MFRMNAVCLTIDGLQAGFLGCYGNAWVRTPACDALAAEGFVFDNALIDSPSLDLAARSWWQGRHAAHRGDDAWTLPRALDRAGVRTVLLTDDAGIAGHPLAAEFAERILLPCDEAACLAESEDETQFARGFAALIEATEKSKSPFLLWAHFRGMLGPWDAPYEFRAQYADDDDPRPGEFCQPPARLVAADADPDALLEIRQAYAGQVSLFDAWLGMFLSSLNSRPDFGQTLLLLACARGIPLGVHGQAGFLEPDDGPLFGDLVHVPFLARLPNGAGAACRTAAFVQPADIAAGITGWFAVPFDESPCSAGKSFLRRIRGEPADCRDRACIVAPSGERAIRTPGWYLRQLAVAGDAAEPRCELFAKPDDRWEINEVSALRPDVVAAMQQALQAWQATVDQDGSAMPPLEAMLATKFHD
jgi:arylsulfatase A-like enzyme